MKKELLDKYFNKIREITRGDNTSDSDIIDYLDGSSISKSEIEEEYYRYLELNNNINDYIEENDLDDIKDMKKIAEHFNLDEKYFFIGQAALIDFVDYMKIKIENR